MFETLLISWNHCDNQQIYPSYTAYPSLLDISLPFPQNVHHIHCDHFGGLWSHYRWWSRTPQLNVCSGTNQRGWHSIQCHLHTGGRHHWALHWVGTYTPQRCALVFGNWVGSFISFCRQNAGCGVWSHQSHAFAWRTH